MVIAPPFRSPCTSWWRVKVIDVRTTIVRGGIFTTPSFGVRRWRWKRTVRDRSWCSILVPFFRGLALVTDIVLSMVDRRFRWHDKRNRWHPPKEGIDEGLVGRLLRLPWFIV